MLSSIPTRKYALKRTGLAALVSLLVVWTGLVVYPSDRSDSVQVAVHTNATCTNNVVRLADVAEIKGSPNLVETLGAISLGPAPGMGKSQTWSRQGLQKQIDLLGLNAQAIQWKGADTCNLRRVEQANRTGTKLHSLNSTIASTQAEKNVQSVIFSYLNTIDPTSSMWKVTPIIPPELAPLLTQRRQFKEIGGGSEPWDGRQEFQLIIATANGERSVTIEAIIQTPPKVLAARRPLRPGHVLSEEDLELVSLALNSRTKPEDCSSDWTELIGKELRKGMSTGQAIARIDVGSPRVVDTSDLVKVEFVNGDIVIEANGKCLGPGGVHDLIQVEILPQKKKMLAQVIGSGRVRIAGSKQ